MLGVISASLQKITLILLAFILFFVFLEGLSSTLLSFYGLTRRTQERRHTKYDKELGWVNIQNIYIPDMYGPGRSFKTNSQGFRNDKDFDTDVPKGKIRVVCSGDSFTLGYGVSNQDTWCHQLSLIDNSLETVNMGQGGYGIDQAYLWYMRDGTKLRHDLHLFAFVTEDFRRMKADNFQGYGKPVLDLKDGSLVTRNVPVPRKSYFSPRLTEAIRNLNKFRLFELLTKVYLRIAPPLKSADSDLRENHTQAVASKVFDALAETNRAKGSILLLIYLPAHVDHSQTESDIWREWLATLSAKKGFLFLDLVEGFRKLPRSEVATLFRGHYSEKGNKNIAANLYKRLFSLNGISDRLRAKAADGRRNTVSGNRQNKSESRIPFK